MKRPRPVGSSTFARQGYAREHVHTPHQENPVGYDPNRIDASLADVVGDTPDRDDHLFDHDDWWLYDLDYDCYEDDREPYYHGIDLEDDYDEELPEAHDVDDPHEIVMPKRESVNLAWAGNNRRYHTKRYKSACRRVDNSKPKRKDHRS